MIQGIGNTLAHSPAEVLRQLLIDIGQGSLPNMDREWPIYVNQQVHTPDNILCLTDTGALPHGFNHTVQAIRKHFGVEVLVRAVPTTTTGTGGYTTGWEKIGLVEQNLLGVLNRVVTIQSYSYIVHAVGPTSSPLPQGPDQTNNERNLFSCDFNTAITQL